MSITSPDDRVTTNNPVTPTTEFPATFPVFDNDDINVFVDGVERFDFAVSATYVEGISNDAKAVFAVGVTGTVHVVGSRAPHRTNRFGNGPLPTRDLNLALDTLEAESQEQSRDIDRSHKAPFGVKGSVLDASDIANAQENAELAQEGKDSAEAAQAAAEAAAAAALAVANGAMVFKTHADFIAASINSSISSVFVAGFYNPDGNGAKRLHRIAAPGAPNAIQFQIADGSWWQISDTLKNPAMIGARTDGFVSANAKYAEFIAYANAAGEAWEVPPGVSLLSSVHVCTSPVVMTGVIKCGFNPAAAGLQLKGQPIVIGDYLRIYCDGDISLIDPTAPNAHQCHTAAMQAAANELMGSTKYVSLNMEGRRLTTSQQINFDLGLTPGNDANRASRYASNFIIDAHSSFTSTDYIFRVFSSSAPSPSKMNFSNFTLNCGGYASGILYDGAAFDNIATHFRIRNPSLYSINKPNANGSDLLLSNFILEGRTDITLEEKVAIGLNYAGSDLQIANGIIRNHLHQLICDGGAQNLITNVHFYGGGNASNTARRPAGVLLKNSRSAQFTNCYFDGQPFVSLRDDGANTVGYFECTGCLFVVGSNASATAHSYVEVETGPASAGATIEDIIIKDCRFIRGAGGADIEQPMRTRGSGTSSTAQKDVYIFDNTFTNVREQASKLLRYTTRVSGSGGLAWNLDASVNRAFGMNFQHASSPGIVSDVNPGATWVERTGANTFVVRYATAFNGSIKMEFDANSANP